MTQPGQQQTTRPGFATRKRVAIFLYWARIKRFNRLTLVRLAKDTLALLAAVLLGAVVSGIFEAEIETRLETVILIVLCVSTIVWCLAVSILIELNKSIQVTKNYDIFVHRDYRVGDMIQRGAFSLCAAEALKAKSSIIVMGPHFERNEVVPSGTESHDHYLEESMNAAVTRHMSSIDSDFRYERIVQVRPDVFTAIREEGRMEPEQFDNESLARHVKTVLDLSKQTHNAEISISAMPYVPSFPSVLIIDDRFVFVSVPTGITGELGRSDPVESGKPKTNFDLVIGIEDRSGEIPMLFRQVILQFKRSAREITSISDPIGRD